MRALMGTFLALMLALTAGCGDNDDHGGKAATSSAGTEKSTADQNKKYAACIRAHGVPDFPDPGPDGKFSGDGAKNLDRTKLMSAMQACQDLAAGTEIGQATTTMTAEQVEQFRAYAKCMRDRGVDLPDPDPDDSVLSWAQSWQSKVDTDAPTFKSAAEACQKQIGGLR